MEKYTVKLSRQETCHWLHGKSQTTCAQRRDGVVGRLASAGRATRLGGGSRHFGDGFQFAASAPVSDVGSLRRFIKDYHERILLDFELPAIQAAHGHTMGNELRN